MNKTITLTDLEIDIIRTALWCYAGQTHNNILKSINFNGKEAYIDYMNLIEDIRKKLE